MNTLDKRLALALVACVAAAACGYRMQAADYTTLQNMAPNCAENVTLMADAGAQYMQVRATDRTCVCGARGILARAKQPLPDAGKLGCPQ